METKVLMVCLGNICRSPLAEGILQSKVDYNKVLVDSAGTAGYHIGNPPDARSIDVAFKNGIDISYQHSRKFTIRDFDDFHHIFVMDQSNYDNVIALARDANDEKKVDLILNQLYPGENRQVPDPYYGGEQGFNDVFWMLNEACAILAKKL